MVIKTDKYGRWSSESVEMLSNGNHKEDIVRHPYDFQQKVVKR